MNVSGNQIADELEALLKRRPDLSPSKLGMIVRGKRNGIKDLREAKKLQPATVAKIRAFIACPEEAAYIPRADYKPVSREVVERRNAGIRKAAVRTAREHIAQGHDISTAKRAAVRLAGQAVLFQMHQAERLADPIEQAKIALQKARYVPVCSMAMFDGDPSLYRVGSRCNVTVDELLGMAAEVMARAA